jgi:hypothetical protein
MALLLPALALEVAQTTAPPVLAMDGYLPRQQTGQPLPYLCVVGPPPLRFQEALPPPDLASRPPAGAPPRPVGKTQPEVSHGQALDLPIGVATTAPAGVEKRGIGPSEKSLSTTVTTAGPPSTLPDDAHPKVRPEDFLPFFQFPGSGANGSNGVAAPAAPPEPPKPGTLPPSTATYEQQ